MNKNLTYDKTGQKFGKLTVLGLSNKKVKFGMRFWTCICECGNKKDVLSRHLKNGTTKSCGCLRKNMNQNEKNGQWKGNKVSYGSLHSWVKNHLIKPQTCRDCNKPKKLDLANISGEYKRDISDWEWLCRSCHMKKDGRLERFVDSAINRCSMKISYKGEDLTITEWAKKLNIKRDTLYTRIFRYKWPLEKALR